jgi:hypothetical protein
MEHQATRRQEPIDPTDRRPSIPHRRGRRGWCGRGRRTGSFRRHRFDRLRSRGVGRGTWRHRRRRGCRRRRGDGRRRPGALHHREPAERADEAEDDEPPHQEVGAASTRRRCRGVRANADRQADARDHETQDELLLSGFSHVGGIGRSARRIESERTQGARRGRSPHRRSDVASAPGILPRRRCVYLALLLEAVLRVHGSAVFEQRLQVAQHPRPAAAGAGVLEPAADHEGQSGCVLELVRDGEP